MVVLVLVLVLVLVINMSGTEVIDVGLALCILF